MIFIFCLFFQAKEARQEGNEYKIDDSTTNTYSYLTFLEGLQYKQSWILLLLLIVFFYDLFQSKVVSLNSLTLGISLVLLLLLMFWGYFTNTLIYKDKNKNKSYTFINCYKEQNLKENMMIEIDPNIYEKYRYTKGLTCNAQFVESTLVQEAYNYPPYNVKSAIFPESPEKLNPQPVSAEPETEGKLIEKSSDN